LAAENRNRRKRILRQLREFHGPAAFDTFELENKMTRNMIVALYVVVVIVVIVGADLLFFRNRFWDRLMWNIGIVLMFAAIYLRFIKNP
jgi:hypothetical protein